MIDLLLKEFKKYNWRQKYRFKIDTVYTCFIFKRCEVMFYHNIMYSSLECFIVNPKDDSQKYDLSSVLEHNNVDTTGILFNHSSRPISEFVEQYVSFLYNNLLHVIEGDFSWLEKEKERRKNFKIFVDVLGHYDIYNFPSFQKMLRGEEGWEEDLMEYVKLRD